MELQSANLRYDRGPALLVLVLLFAKSRILLLKRGQDPYRGKWAPPGGFVEPNESLETAAARETFEEVGIRIDREELVPNGIISLPKLNQVYVVFIAKLREATQPKPKPPEALDAHWFSESEFSSADLWAPALEWGDGARELFDRIRTHRLDLYQQSDDYLRVIKTKGAIRNIWRKPRANTEPVGIE
jgi:8-oxo-dGTP diphosphatase